MGLIDDLCVAVGAVGRCLFEIIETIFKEIIFFIEDVVSWAADFAQRCWQNLKQGWRMYYVDIDASEIPPTVVPPERLMGAKKISLGVVTDAHMKPKKVDRVFVHNDEDEMLKEQMGGKGVIELVL